MQPIERNLSQKSLVFEAYSSIREEIAALENRYKTRSKKPTPSSTPDEIAFVRYNEQNPSDKD